MGAQRSEGISSLSAQGSSRGLIRAPYSEVEGEAKGSWVMLAAGSLKTGGQTRTCSPLRVGESPTPFDPKSRGLKRDGVVRTQ